MAFSDLTDDQWKKVRNLLPGTSKDGRPRADDRRTINAILFVLEARIPWNYLPKEYGDDSTANRRLKEWRKEGVWERIEDVIGLHGGQAGANVFNVGSGSPLESKREVDSASQDYLFG